MLLSVSVVSITSSSVRRRCRRLQTLVRRTKGCSTATSAKPATTANTAICQEAIQRDDHIDQRLHRGGDEVGGERERLGRAGGIEADRIGQPADRLPGEIGPLHLQHALYQPPAHVRRDIRHGVVDRSQRQQGEQRLGGDRTDHQHQQRPELGLDPDHRQGTRDCGRDARIATDIALQRHGDQRHQARDADAVGDRAEQHAGEHDPAKTAAGVQEDLDDTAHSARRRLGSTRREAAGGLSFNAAPLFPDAARSDQAACADLTGS